MKRLLFLTIVLGLIGCGQGETAESIPTPTPLPTPVVPEKPTYVVQLGTVVGALEFSGRVSPVQEQTLFFKSDGFVDQIFVQRGDLVETGDVLAQLEITDLQTQLAQANVAMESAELRLAQAEQARQDALAEATITREKIALQLQQGQVNTNSAGLVSAQIELENAQERLESAEYELQKSLDRHWEPEELRRQYEQAVETAREAVTVARARYTDALAGGSSSAVARQILEQELALADLRLEQMQRGIDPLLALNVEQARLDVQQIEDQIADARLIAPFAGEVLSVLVQAGSRAEAFAAAVILAQPQPLEITAELGRDLLSQLSIDQPATVTLSNRPEQPFAGTVRQLPYAFSGGTSGSGNEDSRVRIRFDNPPANLALGELARVVVVLTENENVLWLPPAAIRTFQGRTFVVIEEAGGQRRADVRLGIQSPARVEILDGVEVGDVVVGE